MWILGGHGGTYKPVWGSENHWAWRLRPPVGIKAGHTGGGVGRMGVGAGTMGVGAGPAGPGRVHRGRGAAAGSSGSSSVRLRLAAPSAWPGGVGGGSVLVAGTCH